MDVPDPERLSRFLFFKRWFSAEKQRVRPDAFIPHPWIELSVSCTEGLKDKEIWALGQKTAEARSDNPPLLGRADLKAHHARNQGLRVDRNDDPPFHANILGWSTEGRAIQRMKAIELAANSTLRLMPDPEPDKSSQA